MITTPVLQILVPTGCALMLLSTAMITTLVLRIRVQMGHASMRPSTAMIMIRVLRIPVWTGHARLCLNAMIMTLVLRILALTGYAPICLNAMIITLVLLIFVPSAEFAPIRPRTVSTMTPSVQTLVSTELASIIFHVTTPAIMLEIRVA